MPNAPKLVKYWHGTSPLSWEHIKETKTLTKGTITRDKGWAGWHAVMNAQLGKGLIIEINLPKGAYGIDIGYPDSELKTLSLEGRTTAHFFPVYPKDKKIGNSRDALTLLKMRGV